MRIAIRIDAADARRSLEANMPAILERAAKRVGIIVEGQTKARFDNSGDEEGAWPELWINTQRALDAIRAQQGVGAAKAKVAAEGRAQVAYERVLDKIDDGKLTGAKAIQAKRQARRKWRLARTGLPEPANLCETAGRSTTRFATRSAGPSAGHRPRSVHRWNTACTSSAGSRPMVRTTSH